MTDSLAGISASSGDPVAPDDIAAAVTAASLVYADGASQVFQPSGTTTYTEQGRDSHGEWYVDGGGRFCSFWPPSYVACYDLQWVVQDGAIVGLTFIEPDGGSRFDGRYQ
jgi:hypothetical protein